MIVAIPKPTKKERRARRMVRRPVPSQKFAKPQPWRSEEYLAFVRRHNCCVCGESARWAERISAAHFGEHGLATKATDWQTLPLCPPCHKYQGTMRIEEWAARMHLNPWRIAFTILTEWLKQKYREAENQ